MACLGFTHEIQIAINNVSPVRPKIRQATFFSLSRFAVEKKNRDKKIIAIAKIFALDANAIRDMRDGQLKPACVMTQHQDNKNIINMFEELKYSTVRLE